MPSRVGADSVPKARLTMKKNEPAPRENGLILCFGFVSLLTVNDLILREPALFFDGFGIGGYSLVEVRVWMNVAFFGALLTLGTILLLRRREARPVMLCAGQFACGMVALGVAAAIFLPWNVPSSPLFNLVAFLMGLYAALGLTAWVALWTSLSREQAWINIAICLLVSAFTYVFFLYLAMQWNASFVFSLLYAASLAFTFWIARKTNPQNATRSATRSGTQSTADSATRSGTRSTTDSAIRTASEPSPSDQPPIGKAFSQAIRENYPALLCITALNFVLTASRTTLVHASNETVNAICALGIMTAGACLFVLAARTRSGVDIKIVYEVAFPFVALAFLVLPLLSDGWRAAFMFVSTTIGTMGSTLLFLMSFQVKDSYSLPATGMYGLFSGFMHIFLTMGLVAGFGEVDAQGDLVRYTVLACLLVYALFLVLAVGRRRISENSESAGIVFIGSEQAFARRCAEVAESASLSSREQEIMALLSQGKSVNSIAEELGISVNTVRTHNKNLYKKLGVHTKGDLLELLVSGVRRP